MVTTNLVVAGDNIVVEGGLVLSKPFVETGAVVSPSANVGAGTRIWGLAHIRENVRLGKSCIIGRGVYVGSGVQIGDNCKVQNDALIYEPARLGNGVFVGPAAVLTNDLFPRAVNSDGSLKSVSDWEPVGVVVEEGASIGARAVCVAPITIGAWAMVAAGAVVTKDVASFSLVQGVPARHAGWVGRAGVPLQKKGDVFVCPATGELYEELSGSLRTKDA